MGERRKGRGCRKRDGEKARRDHRLFRMQLWFASIPSVLSDAARDVCFVCNPSEEVIGENVLIEQRC